MSKVHLYMRTDFSEKFHKMGFWILVALIMGLLLGSFATKRVFEWQLSKSVTYKAIEINGQKYDLKERI